VPTIAPAPLLTTLKEYKRPMPVDKKHHPNVPPNAIGKARGHLGIMEYARGDWNLQTYSRTPWSLMTNKWRQHAMRSLIWRTSSVITIGSWTAEDGTSNTVQQTQTSASTSSVLAAFKFNDGVSGNDQVKLKYGSSSTATSGTHDDIQTVIGAMYDAGSVAYDDTLFQINASGSRVHTEANDTIREIAIFASYINTSTTRKDFMVDRSLPTATAVTTGQTVAISYQFQF